MFASGENRALSTLGLNRGDESEGSAYMASAITTNQDGNRLLSVFGKASCTKGFNKYNFRGSE